MVNNAPQHPARNVVIDDITDGVTFQLPATTYDAFGRVRTSGTGQRLDVEFIYNKQDEFFDEITNNGTVTHNANSRDLTLSLSDAVDGSYATMASHPVPYTPGNSQLEDITGVLDLAAIGSGVAQVFIRSKITGTVVETATDQTSWSADTVSDADWTASQIFTVDFQSIKVGRIRFMMVRNGLPTLVHEIYNDNTRNTGYWQSPTLPAYWKIYNDATYTYMECGYGDDNNAIGFRYRIAANASATMRAICVTVKSEGGLSLDDMPGLPRSADNGTTVVTADNTLTPILSIRAASTFNSLPNLGIALPISIGLQTDNPIRLAVMHDVVLTSPSWVAVGDSIIEYDVSATDLSGGHAVFSDYFSSTAKNRATAGKGLLGKTVIWDRKNTSTGILTIAAIRTTGTDADILSSFSWREIR